MAPQNKRSAASKAPVATKKAKVEKVEEQPEDPAVAQLAPVFATIAASKLPPSCYELLQAALPHCMGVTMEERHAYQTKMLDLTTEALKNDEADKRNNLTEAEQKVSQLQAEVVASKADADSAEALATAKKEESQKKSEEVAAATAEVEASKQALELETKNKEGFLTGKAALVEDEQAFLNVLANLWEPLKASSFLSQQYRKRDKAIMELLEKIKPLELEDCLLDAVVQTLKLRQDKRSEFAEKATRFIEDAFERHKAQFTERIAATGAQEQEHEKAVTDADSKLGEMREKFAARRTEHEQLENVWAVLETSANEAKEMVSEHESSLKAAQGEVENRSNELTAVLAVSETFVQIRDPPREPVVVAVSQPEVSAENIEVEEPAMVETPLVPNETTAVAVTA